MNIAQTQQRALVRLAGLRIERVTEKKQKVNFITAYSGGYLLGTAL